jgi:hypothetical protein
MSDPMMIKLITERRKRLVASILGHAEREFYSQLNATQRGEFRAKVLSSVDEFADLVRDLLKVTGEDAVVNEHVLDLLEQLHTKVNRL